MGESFPDFGAIFAKFIDFARAWPCGPENGIGTIVRREHLIGSAQRKP
jgi:hypothetical protein